MYIWLEETASSLLGADNADELEWRLLVVACIYFLTFGLVTIVLPAPYGKFSKEALLICNCLRIGKFSEQASTLPLIDRLTTVKLAAPLAWCVLDDLGHL